MEKKTRNSLIALVAIIVVIQMFFSLVSLIKTNKNSKAESEKISAKTFKIISSSENKDLEEIVKNYARLKNYNIEIEYAGTLDIMQKLNLKENYDAVWTSNSIWLYMLNNDVKVSNSKCTSINPVIFAINKTKAKELGFIDKTVYMKDILSAISSGKLKFSMSNPTSTNSGASAYLGFLSTFAGNPEVIKKDNLEDKKLKENLISLFTGMERSSGSEDFLEELFLNGDYEAVVTYESSIININKQLIEQGKEPLYAIYPVDGVSISDSPFAYIDNKDEKKKEIFTDLQSYILSNEGQKLLQEKGRRTWYGGISNDADKTIFNPEWGIDTSKYISPVKYPNTQVIKLALNLYQNELRKPVHVVFCLDYSGSMSGEGKEELVKAMEYILTEEAANDFLQFSEKDKIDIVPFSGRILNHWKTEKGNVTNTLLENIKTLSPNGSTAIYDVAAYSLDLLKNEDLNKYNVSIILMTDGANNMGSYANLYNSYKKVNKNIPIYSITFGDAYEGDLIDIADLTTGKVFDGKTDLVKAFKEVRGYN